jgi:hypothetical protein
MGCAPQRCRPPAARGPIVRARSQLVRSLARPNHYLRAERGAAGRARCCAARAGFVLSASERNELEIGAAPPLRLRGVWISGAAALVAGLVYLCLLPAQEVPDLGLSDFAEHAGGYLVLMLWFAALSARARWLLLAGALALLGLGLEWLQGALAIGRVSDPRDVAANTLGVAFGLALAYAGLGRWMHWIEARVLRL